MVDKIFYPQPIVPVKGSGVETKTQNITHSGKDSFKDILDKQIKAGEIKFSAHAQQRLASRNIQLTKADLEKLGDAVERAAKKGAKDSLVMMDNMAFVVSVRSKTVVTALDSASMKEHIFTNIDSAVFA